MKTLRYFFLVLLINTCSQHLVAQQVIKGKTINLTSTSLPELNESSPSVQPKRNIASKSSAANYSAGSTMGTTDVTPSGALSYTIPIEVPPGIQDQIPAISLNYNSQGGNGVAGFGWNLSGISKITKISASDYYDKLIDPVDFDGNDRFALDGQRLLLKSGTYGSGNSEYQTENYSNIKIIGYGQSRFGSKYGPSYFIVYHPDGSRVWYGSNSNSNGRLEWGITKVEDVNGNTMSYVYQTTGGLLQIKSVSYGSQSVSNSVNKIEFAYKNRQRKEHVAYGNQTFVNSQILSAIRIVAKNATYRRYSLKHDVTTLGYERLTSITEFNGIGQSKAPITFSYDNTSDSIKPYMVNGSGLKIFPGLNIEKHAVVSGDFNGDARMDMILHDQKNPKKLFVFEDLSSGLQQITASEFNVPRFTSAFASSALNTNGVILGKQTITTVNESGYDINFTNYISNPEGLTYNYSKTWKHSFSTRSDIGCREDETIAVKQEYLSGDFDGDGITDVIAVAKSTPATRCEEGNYEDDCHCRNTYKLVTPNATLINLDPRNTSNYIFSLGKLANNFRENDRVVATDYDNDGKTDVVHMYEGAMTFYSLNSQNTALIKKLTINNSSIKMKWPILQGDFNGDGKVDFVTPTADNSSTWRFFLGRGTSYINYVQNIGVWFGEGGVSKDHVFPEQGPTDELKLYEYHYIAQDYNNDGKTDILSQHVITEYSTNNWSTVKLSLHVNKFRQTDNYPSFEPKGYREDNSNTYRRSGIPVFLDLNQRTANQEFMYIDGNTIHGFEFQKDHRKDVCMKQITNNGVTTEIAYNTVVDNDTESVYTQTGGSTYPYLDIKLMTGIDLVSRLTEKGSGVKRYKDFRYFGATSHLQGIGYLGFKGLSRTNWYGDGVGTIWTNELKDPLKKGATTLQWTWFQYANKLRKYITKTDSKYVSTTYANKVFKNLPQTITFADDLTGITKTETMTYDGYGNPIKIVKSYSGGSHTSEYQYYNNAAAQSKDYHIGRPKKQKEIAVLKGELYENSKTFTYSANRLSKLVKKGNGSQTLTYSYTYDRFGNVITKKTPGVTSDWQYSYKYDTSGRFLLEERNHLGQVTKFAYNTTDGIQTGKTDVYGRVSTFKYDAWQREIEAIDYLGKKTTSRYDRLSDGGIRISLDAPQRTDSQVTFNAFGWKTSEQASALNNKNRKISYQYDVGGKTTATSEPYFSTASPSQWNRNYYDEYGRMIRNQLFTGKIITSTYDKLKLTTNDGTKTASTTKDAVGNIVSITDPGGTINYTYHANGIMKESDYSGHKVTTKIDQWGRKVELNDPSAGKHTYGYNKIGLLLYETKPSDGGRIDYTYDSKGLLQEKYQRDNSAYTDVLSKYTYNARFNIAAITSSTADKINYDYKYEYDQYERQKKVIETIEDDQEEINFILEQMYDGYGRLDKENYTTESILNYDNPIVEKQVIKTKNQYDSSGILVRMLDANTNQSLWQVDEENQRGQYTKMTLGNGYVMNRGYDTYGNPLEFKDTKIIGNQTKTAYHTTYNFDAKRNILKDRNNLVFNRKETFTHDVLDRLTKISGAVNQSQLYDPRGLIQTNSEVGNYRYKSGAKRYQTDKIDLNTKGKEHYQKNPLQNIIFDGFKRPVQITEKGTGKISFFYGPGGQRSHASYLSDKSSTSKISYNRIYSSIIPSEIHVNNTGKSTKIINYIGGDAYTAPVAHVKISGFTSYDSGYHYIHRDYLGSIMALTTKNNNVREQVHFGAWGSVDKMKSNTSFITKGFSSVAQLGRGFTGHEYFTELGIIHMNGRIYDPMLRRFLSPDNHIQAPYTTQSFNRYSYVWNNPLTLNDPTGEVIPLIVGIVLAVGAVSGAYLAGAQANGSYNPFKWDWSSGSTWGAIVGGAAVGTAAAGIGLAVGAVVAPALAGLGITGGVLGGAIVGLVSGAVSGAFTGAVMAVLPGGNGDVLGGMLSGMVSGAIGGAIIGGVVGGITTKGNFWTGAKRPVATPISDLKTSGPANLDDGLSLKPDNIPDPARLNAIKDAKAVPIDTNAGPKAGPIDTKAGGNLKIKAVDLPKQMHHFATNKHSIYTQQMDDIAKNFDLKLDGAWNKELLPHLGRHPHKYHEFVLSGMKRAAAQAGSSQTKFLQFFNQYVKQPVISNPDLLNKTGWK